MVLVGFLTFAGCALGPNYRRPAIAAPGTYRFLGRVSPELSAFTADSGNVWNVGGTVAGPVFQGVQLRAQYRAAKAKSEEAKAGYQQSVLTAFREVSDALISGQKLAEVRTYDEQAVVALSSSVELATERYLNGKSSYFEVLQAQLKGQ